MAATLAQPSTNPFRSIHDVSPQTTGVFNAAPSATPVAAPSTQPNLEPAATGTPTGAASSNTMPADVAEPASQGSSIPQRRLPVEDEEPPPYTPSADVHHGEATIEYGPARPFQRPQAAPARLMSPAQSPPPPNSYTLPTHYTGTTPRLGSLWNQLTGSLSELANVANDRVGRAGSSSRYGPTVHHTGSSTWSYPGHNSNAAAQQAYSPPPFPPRPPHQPSGFSSSHPAPPQHPAAAHSRPHSLAQTHAASAPPPQGGGGDAGDRRASSEFARDFYAAGASVPPELVPDSTAASASSTTTSSSPNAPGKPTTAPTAGRPLLRDGKLLVYPKGFECDKCHNIGYKLPSMKPCKKCWPKYGKPFVGPLAYSYGDSSTENANNFQRPLPPQQTPPRPPPRPAPQQQRPNYHHSATSAFHTPLVPQSYGSYRPQQVVMSQGRPHAMGMPGGYPGRSGNSVVYAAGDPRIGGSLCWKCRGTGTVTVMLIDREQCFVCKGLGRTFR